MRAGIAVLVLGLLLVPVVSFAIYLAASAAGLRRGALALSGVCVVLIATRSLAEWRYGLANGIEHIELSHGEMAAYLNAQHYEGPIAVFDISRIGYDWNGKLVDLGGLTDVNYTEYLVTGRVPEYLKEHGIRLLVLPTNPAQYSGIGEALGLVMNPAVSFQPLHMACSPYQVWVVGWNLTRHAMQCQGLFKVTIR